jgi:hypothetical protein
MVASGPGSIGTPSKGSINVPDGPYESRHAVSMGASVLAMNIQCRRLETTNPVQCCACSLRLYHSFSPFAASFINIIFKRKKVGREDHVEPSNIFKGTN